MSRNYYSFLFLTCWFAVTGCGISSTSNPEQRVESSKSNAPVSSVSENFRVKFETSKGDFIVEVNPEWAPRGAKRFQELVNSGFFDECRFFRVLDSFMAQFGINGDPNVQKKWGERSIPDDRVTQSQPAGFSLFRYKWSEYPYFANVYQSRKQRPSGSNGLLTIRQSC